MPDGSFFVRRTEVRCAACDAHLGLRYCINGTAMTFAAEAVPEKSQKCPPAAVRRGSPVRSSRLPVGHRATKNCA